jgi:predicted PurR-regulated permease PerM
MEPIRLSPRAKVIVFWVLVVLALLFFWRVRDVALPFVWALVTAYLFLPVVRFLAQRTHAPRWIWITVLYLVGGAVVYVLVTVLIPVVGRQYEEFLKAAPGIISDVQAYIAEHERIEVLGFTLNVQAIAENLVQVLGDLARRVPQQALAGVTLVLTTVTKIVIYLIATFYFLLLGDRWARQLVDLLPERWRNELAPLFQRIHALLKAYILGQVLRMFIMGTLIYIGLSVLQVRFALVLAIMGGVLELVPILGPVVAGTITTIVALFQPQPAYGWSNLTLAAAVAILYVGLNQLEENFLIPNLLGYMVDLPPLLVIFVVLAGESLAGIPGLLLAVPVAATLHVVLRYLYARMMDRPDAFEAWVAEKERPRHEKLRAFLSRLGRRLRFRRAVSAVQRPAEDEGGRR